MASDPNSSKVSINPEFVNNAKNIESARFLKRILHKADDETTRLGKVVPDCLERAFFFTGLDRRVFTTFKSDMEASQIVDIDRSLIHDRLITLFLNASRYPPKGETTPTTKNLFAFLYGKLPNYMDIRSFRKLLAKMGYVWMKMSKGYIVIERPSVTFERYFYLKDILQYRQENREIFYVDEGVMSTSRKYYDFEKYKSLMKSAAKAGVEINQTSLTKHIYAVSKTGVYALRQMDDFRVCNFEKWIIDDLLPLLPPKSVVVIRNYQHHDNRIKKPTLYSTKSDMMDWLEQNNVTYDETMSKCDLITLIDTYTSEIDEISKIDVVLKRHSHVTLRLPFSIADLSPAKYLFDIIKLNAPDMKVPHEDVLPTITESITKSTLEDYDQKIASFESDTFKIDTKMDEVFDDVVKEMQNARLNDMEDSEVPLSDSD